MEFLEKAIGSNNPKVTKITNGESIPFKNGRPDFSSWSKGNLTFAPSELNGISSDFTKVYEVLKNELGLNSNNAAKQWLKSNGLTPHHYNSTTIQLISTDLHGMVPHIGSASDLRVFMNCLKIKKK